ncbi:MAG: dynamin family protein [Acidithiobacillus sp.]|nr:dynamin family protein [Acidithiobacillus sp.]
MEAKGLIDALQDFDAWRQEVAKLVEQVSSFSHRLDLLPSGTMLRLEILARELRVERVSISFYGEFARGKSELINSLFFYDQQRRFLPSGVGQTTMCPVEISASENGQASLELLPIQTRTMHGNILELKKDPSYWKRFPLPMTDPVAVSQVLQQLQETQCVPLAEARRFGLCPALDSTRPQISHCPPCGEGKVKISRWRFALLRLVHPALHSGLIIIDTPGLNSLGSEAELGLDAARMADASIFVLAADSGVTQSDLQIWDQSLGIHSRQRQLVVLNKCDLLVDELDPPEERLQAEHKQQQFVAERLQMPLDHVIPISAREALIGRLRADQNQLERSGILRLEQAIANILIPGKRHAIAANTQQILQRVLMDQRFILEEQLQVIHSDMESMLRLQAQAGEQVPVLLERQRKILEHLELDWTQFRILQEEFRQEARGPLLESLSLEGLDQIIEKSRSEILAVWTTFGIYERFSQFFIDTIAGFDQAMTRANRLSERMMTAYRGLEQRYSLPRLDTLPYVLLPRRSELLALSDYYERFGKRLEIAAYPQGVVVRKAFLQLANRVRTFVQETRRDLLSWVEESLDLMNGHLDRCRGQAQERTAALSAIAESSASVQQRIDALNLKESRIHYEIDELTRLQQELDGYFQAVLSLEMAS